MLHTLVVCCINCVRDKTANDVLLRNITDLINAKTVRISHIATLGNIIEDSMDESY